MYYEKDNIYFKHIKIYNHYIHNKYLILAGSKQIGEIVFTKKNKIFIIGFIEIYQEYRNKHYGYKIIEYILSHYKINCIIGETLSQSKGFWNKCIKKFNGQRKNISVCDNCSSSFVIPKCNISNEQIYELLEVSYEIS